MKQLELIERNGTTGDSRRTVYNILHVNEQERKIEMESYSQGKRIQQYSVEQFAKLTGDERQVWIKVGGDGIHTSWMAWRVVSDINQMTQAEAEQQLVGMTFVETEGYHRGEYFTCEAIGYDFRDRLAMWGTWHSGITGYEPLATTTVRRLEYNNPESAAVA